MNGHDRRRQEKYEQILDSALELFARSGISNVTITEIAETASVSRVTIFKYFTSRDELIRECIRRYFSNLSRKIEMLLNRKQIYQKRLHSLISTKIESFHAFKGDLFPWLRKQNPTFINEIMELRRLSINDSIIPFIDEGRRNGLIYSDLQDDAIFTFIDVLGLGLMFSPLSKELESKESVTLEEMLIIAVRALMKTD